VALGAEPGTVHVLRDWRQAARHSSTAHEMNVAELIQTSMLLGECPEQVTVVGIEPERVETGVGLSQAVSHSISKGADAARKIISP
jgi:hydrogenase maturation protease